MTPTTSLRYIQVALNLQLRVAYTYALSSYMEVEVGGVVCVNFNGRLYHAVVIATDVVPDIDPIKIKQVKYVVCRQYYNPELFKSLETLAEYNIAPIQQALFAGLPPILRSPSKNEEFLSFDIYYFSKELKQIFEQGIEIIKQVNQGTAKKSAQSVHSKQSVDIEQSESSSTITDNSSSEEVLPESAIIENTSKDFAETAEMPELSADSEEFYQFASKLFLDVDTKAKKALKEFLAQYDLTLKD